MCTVYCIDADLSQDIEKIFEHPVANETTVQHWPFTFPVLRPGEEYQPVEIDLLEGGGGGVLYLNAMESVAAAMEGSVIAARNVALKIVGKQLISRYG